MLGAAGEAPAPGQAIAALGRHRLARRIGRGDQRGIVLTPHVLRRPVVKQSEVEAVDAQYAEHPADRDVAFSQGGLYVEEGARRQFPAAPAFGLENLEEAGRLQVGHRLIEDATVGLLGRGALDQGRDQRAGAVHQRLRRRYVGGNRGYHYRFPCYF